MTSPLVTGHPLATSTDQPCRLERLGSARQLLWRALATRRRDLVAASVLYSTHQLGESMVPVVIGLTISQAVDRGGWASIGLWLAVLAVDFAFLSTSYRFGARASMRAKQHIGHRVRMWLTDRVVGPAGGVDYPPGDLLSRAASDANRVGAYAGMFAIAVAAVVVLVVSTVVLLFFSPILGVIILASTVLLLASQNVVSKLLTRRSTAEQYQRARATVLAEDLIRGLRVLKGIGAQRNAAAEYQRASQIAAAASLHAVSAQASLSSVGAAFTGLYLVIIGGVGGWLALTGHLNLGQLVAALGLAQFVIGAMTVLSGATAAYARALASAERIREVLVADVAVSDPAHDGASAGDLVAELEFVGVALDRASSPLTARIPAGMMTGIACGDPVLAARIPRLLAREHDPATGAVLLNGTSIAELPLDVLRSRMLVNYHDTALLPGSIADNLSALSTDPSATARATEAAFADQVIQTAAEGASTLVGDRGETLSGGQRQRVALARALAADPAVLVLHDPTTAVDAATENGMAARIQNLRAGRTTLVVTTSPAWLSRCDQVLFLTPNGWTTGGHATLLDEVDYREAVAR